MHFTNTVEVLPASQIPGALHLRQRIWSIMACVAWLTATASLWAADPLPSPTPATSAPTSATIELQISPGATLYGVVLDRITSAPIQLSFIELSGDAELTTATTAGRFLLERITPGDYVITGSADFYSTASARLKIQMAERIGPIMLRLEPMAGIQGFVVDAEGISISDVDVHLSYRGDWNFRAPRPTSLPVTQTDYNGEFHVAGVTPDRVFNLVFTRDGYATASAGPFKLIPGQLETDVKVTMQPGSSIQGIVVDEEEYPIDGAEVGIMQAEGQFRGAPPIARLAAATIQGPDRGTKTEVDGRFTLNNLPDGNFTVFARKDGYVYAYKDEVSVPKGGVSEEIKLVLRKGSILSGFVKNSNEEPVPGARVTATRFNFRDPARDMAVTDDQGFFSMESLLPGEYVVNVQAENHPELNVRNQQVPQEDVVFILKDGGILRGTVKSSSTDKPITKFTVEVSLQAGRGGQNWQAGPGGQGGPGAGMFGGGGGNNRYTFEDSEGVFEIKNLAEGNYRVQVRSAGYAPSSRDRVGIKESETTEIEIAMTDGLALRGIVMKHRDRSPVASASVDLLNDQGGGGRGGPGGGGQPVASGETDAMGAFEFTELMPGTFRLRVRADGFTEYTEQIVLKPASDEEVEVYLRSGGIVIGRVLDGASNQPLQGAQVNITDGGNAGNWGGGRGGQFFNANSDAITGVDGAFVIDPVAEGKVNVRVTQRNYSSKDYTGQEVRSDETLNLGDIVLTSGGGIKGKVTRADGSGVSGAFMTANGPSGFRNTQTAGNGSFEWNTLQAGEYTVSINRLPGDDGGGRRGGFAQLAQKTVTVKDGEVAECDFQLQTGVRLTGLVTYNGEPADDWRITYTRTSGANDDIDTRNGTTQTNRNGEFSFEDLTSGQYTISVNRRGGGGPGGWGGGAAVVERKITIADADEYIELAIPESTVAGRVVDAETQQPIQGARVTILRADTSLTADDILGGRLTQYRNTRSNSQGNFDIDNVIEGEWTVVAQHDNYSYALQNVTVSAGENVEGLSFSLTAGLSLTVTAIARNTGTPVKNLTLQIYDSSGSMVREGNYTVDSLGKCIVTGLKEGRQTLSGFSNFYSPVLGLSVSMMPDNDNRATLEFEDGGTLKVTVKDAAGQPVKGATARIIYGGFGMINYPIMFRNQVNYPIETVTNASGVLTHAHLPSGFVTVEITPPGGGTGSSDSVQIINGQTSELHVTIN